MSDYSVDNRYQVGQAKLLQRVRVPIFFKQNGIAANHQTVVSSQLLGPTGAPPNTGVAIKTQANEQLQLYCAGDLKVASGGNVNLTVQSAKITIFDNAGSVMISYPQQLALATPQLTGASFGTPFPSKFRIDDFQAAGFNFGAGSAAMPNLAIQIGLFVTVSNQDPAVDATYNAVGVLWLERILFNSTPMPDPV